MCATVFNLKEESDWLSVDLRELPEFYRVDPTFAGFAFGHERLRPAKASGRFGLRQPGQLACLPQPRPERLVFRRTRHAVRIVRKTLPISQNGMTTLAMESTSLTQDELLGALKALLIAGAILPTAWVVLSWSSRDLRRRLFIVAVGIWALWLAANGILIPVLRTWSIQALWDVLPLAGLGFGVCYLVALVVWLFGHWLAHGSLAQADFDE